MCNRKKFLLSAGIFLFLGFFAITLYANRKILGYQSGIMNIDTVPTSSLVVVFGGGMNEDGSQSAMQEDRVRVGVELFKKGKVSRIMMTGDDGGLRSDEVSAMRAMALLMGVSSTSIIIDPHGYRTYESCYREKFVYGVTSTLVVSQQFHLPRIVYLCESFGIHAVGVSADKTNYGWRQWWAEGREVLARVKAWWQMEITKPMPRSLEK